MTQLRQTKDISFIVKVTPRRRMEYLDGNLFFVQRRFPYSAIPSLACKKKSVNHKNKIIKLLMFTNEIDQSKRFERWIGKKGLIQALLIKMLEAFASKISLSVARDNNEHDPENESR